MLNVDMPPEVARDCLAHLDAAIERAEGAAELARTDEAFAQAERMAVELDCLRNCLRNAIHRATAPSASMPPADCDPVTGQEYGTGA